MRPFLLVLSEVIDEPLSRRGKKSQSFKLSHITTRNTNKPNWVLTDGQLVCTFFTAQCSLGVALPRGDVCDSVALLSFSSLHFYVSSLHCSFWDLQKSQYSNWWTAVSLQQFVGFLLNFVIVNVCMNPLSCRLFARVCVCVCMCLSFSLSDSSTCRTQCQCWSSVGLNLWPALWCIFTAAQWGTANRNIVQYKQAQWLGNQEGTRYLKPLPVSFFYRPSYSLSLTDIVLCFISEIFFQCFFFWRGAGFLTSKKEPSCYDAAPT